MNDKVVSIIVITWNNLAYTKLFLWSLRRWTNWSYKLIFVDNGSTDGTVEYLNSQKDIRLIANKKNLGYPSAVNQAIKLVDTPYFCLLNNDIVVSPNWLKEMMFYFLKHPEIGQLTCNSNCIVDEKNALGKVSFDNWINFKKKNILIFLLKNFGRLVMVIG